ncbi:hypothetical protein BCR33DRAFT_714851 [Rhizoclosmatium globosum]|uniref:Uncharacterized protein n=1 Tax=Rhizoclosmatium globosum TaxID=329046 RepID=A0A1Y2CN67_9FUNG|nr:hypothetical protein BCR33DRAFT_714851 [Rhizoclosmatium globosum]|eukprot:ORY47785.1 hypothetical protein BCR33DRAFT_714851 [Rhizoclosmatium globosum]
MYCFDFFTNIFLRNNDTDSCSTDSKATHFKLNLAPNQCTQQQFLNWISGTQLLRQSNAELNHFV